MLLNTWNRSWGDTYQLRSHCLKYNKLQEQSEHRNRLCHKGENIHLHCTPVHRAFKPCINRTQRCPASQDVPIAWCTVTQLQENVFHHNGTNSRYPLNPHVNLVTQDFKISNITHPHISGRTCMFDFPYQFKQFFLVDKILFHFKS